jgi:hypothetical protein
MENKERAFVAAMPLIELGKSGWSWLGVSLAKTLREKLLIAGLDVVPCYEIALKEKVDPKPFTSWESLIRLSDFIPSGHVLTGSCLFDEKRVKIYVYEVKPDGLRLLAQEDETKENFMRLLDRICFGVADAFGKPTNAQIRDYVKAATATTDQEAYEKMIEAFQKWAAHDLSGVEEAVAESQEIDPDFVDPLVLLARATRDLSEPEEAQKVWRRLLTDLMASTDFKALAIIDEILAQAQRAGNNELAADCLKARSAVQGNLKSDDIAPLYQERTREAQDAMESLLDKSDLARLRVLQKNGWSVGEATAFFLLGKSWQRHAEVNAALGRYAVAKTYAVQASSLFTIAGNAEKYRLVRNLVEQMENQLAAMQG